MVFSLILSRTPQISDDLYEALGARLDDRGIDSTRLILTEQPVSAEDGGGQRLR